MFRVLRHFDTHLLYLLNYQPAFLTSIPHFVDTRQEMHRQWAAAGRRSPYLVQC